MALYAIADLHLPLGVDKPMDIFGDQWKNYVERLADNWQSKINEDDTIVLPGDFSWATYIEQSEKDFEFLNKLNGRKILLKGNHDYWWTTMNKMKQFVEKNTFSNIFFLQNNSYMYGNIAICGTRGWIHNAWDGFSDEDKKLFNREVLRLEMSLKSAENYREMFVFTHYPPTSNKGENNNFVDVMKKYSVTKCIYGHLHAASQRYAIEGVYNGIEYILSAGDYIGFDPILLSE